ncbi:MAG: hypothetical protein JWM95_2691 [Gemmatimonadetes bacterium]|nr:hypothetical protein [Gemmatimonadota bacterium]
MNTVSESAGQCRTARPGQRERKGVALVFVLIFVVAMAALAMSSIFMASNANLLAKSYDRERDLKYAAEAALAIGKSRVNADPLVLTISPDSADRTILSNQSLQGADGIVLAGIKINIYVGPTGSTSGQFGRFSSIVAEARDQRGNGFIRRLELTQESFAKFAYWSNNENLSSGATIFFNNGDALWGPVWSNDTISIGSGGASFHDEVGTVWTVEGAGYGTFSKGKKEHQKPIALPTNAALATLGTLATSSGWNFTSASTASNTETSVRDRIEFMASDLNNLNDSTDLNEGFFRFYTAKSGQEAALRGDWPGDFSTPPTINNVTLCGDWHYGPNGLNAAAGTSVIQFYPASVHALPWFRLQVRQGYIDKFGWTAAKADSASKADSAGTLTKTMRMPNARCYLAGDPHLPSTDRVGQIDPKTTLAYPTAAIQKGGTDTTFTPNGVNGSWKSYSATPNDTLKKYRPWDAGYLYAIDRLYNPTSKGVIYTSGNVGLSGTLNGRITLYAKGSIVLLDDLRYANDPVKGVCRDILGLISDKDITIADNAINTPQLLSSGNWESLDDTKDLYIHAVMMALGSSFRAENYTLGSTSSNTCDAIVNGRGCIYLSGGIIQLSRGAVALSDGHGFAKRYSYDHCAVVNPPPYFPTTGRFQDNRYLELDPAGFNHTKYFQSLTPNP